MSTYKWKVCPIQGRQLKDVREEDIFGDFRFCNTYRGGGGYDQFPIIAKRRGMSCRGNIGLQFVVQLYGCKLRCPYCYVTEDGIRGEYKKYTSEQLLEAYEEAFKTRQPGVFHLMGGAPALYNRMWPELVKIIPDDVIFHSDLMLTERKYNVNDLFKCNRRNTLYAVNIKGVTPENYLRNTGQEFPKKKFWSNLYRLATARTPFYLTFTNPDKNHLDEFKDDLVRRFGNSVLDDHFVIDLVEYNALKEQKDV